MDTIESIQLDGQSICNDLRNLLCLIRGNGISQVTAVRGELNFTRLRSSTGTYILSRES